MALTNELSHYHNYTFEDMVDIIIELEGKVEELEEQVEEEK